MDCVALRSTTTDFRKVLNLQHSYMYTRYMYWNPECGGGCKGSALRISISVYWVGISVHWSGISVHWLGVSVHWWGISVYW